MTFAFAEFGKVDAVGEAKAHELLKIALSVGIQRTREPGFSRKDRAPRYPSRRRPPRSRFQNALGLVHQHKGLFLTCRAPVAGCGRETSVLRRVFPLAGHRPGLSILVSRGTAREGGLAGARRVREQHMQGPLTSALKETAHMRHALGKDFELLKGERLAPNRWQEASSSPAGLFPCQAFSILRVRQRSPSSSGCRFRPAPP